VLVNVIGVSTQTGFAGVVAVLDAADKGLFPLAFSALTVNVYAVVPDNPVTVMGDVAPVASMLPGEDVTL
jgi:hypothetical protein